MPWPLVISCSRSPPGSTSPGGSHGTDSTNGAEGKGEHGDSFSEWLQRKKGCWMIFLHCLLVCWVFCLQVLV